MAILRNPRILLSGFLILLLCSCTEGGYYLQAAKGQYDILKNRQPIDDLLVSGKLDQQQQLELSRILRMRNFASEKLALPDNGSYRSFVALESSYPLWNVVAAPELSLEPKTWCFPIAGCVSYRGYFSESEATEYAVSLKKRNYDTLVTGVPAYSTLSWFDDPVLSSFSSWPASSVARLIFHELAHQQLYLPGDSAFSEAFATSVELAGSKLWLAAYGSDQDTVLFRRQLEREESFIDWTDSLHQQLAEIYAGPSSKTEKRRLKSALFEEAQHDYLSLKEAWGGYSGYDHWVETLNNARLVSLRTYRKLLPGFDALLAEHNNDFPAFYSACKELADKPAELRQKSLAKLQNNPKLAAQVKQ